METKHIFEDGYYLIGNKAVAKCFLFGDDADCVRFKSKIDQHLTPLCDVLAFGLGHDEFQLIIKMKSRKEIEDYYLSKFASNLPTSDKIPETTYIFAQAMANLQSGYAKFFNFKYERDGGLMKGRYSRLLIESEGQLNILISSVNDMLVTKHRNVIWTFRRKERGLGLGLIINNVKRSSLRCYTEGAESELKAFLKVGSIHLRGHFDYLPPKQLSFENQEEKVTNLIKFLLLKEK